MVITMMVTVMGCSMTTSCSGWDVVRLSCLSSSAPTGTAGWIVDGLRGTEIVPGIAAGAATGIAEVVCGANASLTAGFAGAFRGRGGVGSTLPATK